jgi:hypothetical protein
MGSHASDHHVRQIAVFNVDPGSARSHLSGLVPCAMFQGPGWGIKWVTGEGAGIRLFRFNIHFYLYLFLFLFIFISIYFYFYLFLYFIIILPGTANGEAEELYCINGLLRSKHGNWWR